MLDVRFTNKFKKDLARIEKQRKNPEKLYLVIDCLRQEKKLPLIRTGSHSELFG